MSREERASARSPRASVRCCAAREAPRSRPGGLCRSTGVATEGWRVRPAERVPCLRAPNSRRARNARVRFSARRPVGRGSRFCGNISGPKPTALPVARERERKSARSCLSGRRRDALSKRAAAAAPLKAAGLRGTKGATGCPRAARPINCFGQSRLSARRGLRRDRAGPRLSGSIQGALPIHRRPSSRFVPRSPVPSGRRSGAWERAGTLRGLPPASRPRFLSTTS